MQIWHRGMLGQRPSSAVAPPTTLNMITSLLHTIRTMRSINNHHWQHTLHAPLLPLRIESSRCGHSQPLHHFHLARADASQGWVAHGKSAHSPERYQQQSSATQAPAVCGRHHTVTVHFCHVFLCFHLGLLHLHLPLSAPFALPTQIPQLPPK